MLKTNRNEYTKAMLKSRMHARRYAYRLCETDKEAETLAWFLQIVPNGSIGVALALTRRALKGS